MKKSILTEINFELLVCRIYHSINKIKQRELTNKYHIAPRQLYVLHIIHALGSKATASMVAQMVDRDVHVIGRLTNNLEEAGLIERIHNTPKSRLLNLELTKKGLTMIKINPYSKTLNAILSTLSKEDYAQLESSLYIISTKLKECTPGSSRTGAALKLIRDSDCS